MKRRSFLKAAGAAAGAALCFPQLAPTGVYAAPGKEGPNDRLVFGHIGVGGRGGGLMRGIKRRSDTHIVAVCDADEKRLYNAHRAAGPQSTPYRDYRYVIDRKDIDAVVIATPDHWHAVHTVHAAECGKHIYVEKPACCTIEEGKAMVAAQKKSKVAIQVGSQGRSQPECYSARAYIANGMLGTVRKVTCWHYPSPADNRPVPDSEPPKELDWDLWLGPLRWRPFNRRYCHGVFRWIMESGGGQIRDRGAHVMSNALMFMNADDTGPVSIEATGTLPTRGLWNTAMHMNVKYTFKDPDWEMTWNQPGKPVPYFDRKKQKKLRIREGYGAVYEGDKDSLVVWVGDGQVFTELKAVNYKIPSGGVQVYKSPGHNDDWINGIRTGAKTIMNIEGGAATANLTILGNISLVLGRRINWDPIKKEIVGDEQAHRLMSRPQRHPYHL